MGQLDDGVRRFVAIAYESKREFARRIVLLAQELHAEQAGVEVERAIEITNPEHCVEKPNSIGSPRFACFRRRVRGIVHAIPPFRSCFCPLDVFGASMLEGIAAAARLVGGRSMLTTTI